MRKARWIALLVVLCVCAMSLPAIAQIPSANWPRFQRDANNSGCSPAAVIAKPVLKWQQTLTASSGTWSDIAKCGIAVDPMGNVLVTCAKPWSLAKIAPDGTYLWNSTAATLNSSGYYASNGGPAVIGTNEDYYYLACSGASTQRVGMLAINPSDGAEKWYVADPVIPNTSYRGSASTPTIAPNGEVYMQTAFGYGGDLNGQIAAINSTAATPVRDWVYGFGGTPNVGDSPNQQGTSWMYGASIVTPMTITDTNDPNYSLFDGQTKNVVYKGGPMIYLWESDAWYLSKKHGDMCALVDNGNGTTPSVLWKNYFGYHSGQPVLSNDGSKMYLAGWSIFMNNSSLPDHPNKELTSFDPLTGTINWQMDLEINPLFSPAVGADGTLYLTGSNQQPYSSKPTGSIMRLQPSGRLIAITDNGSSATVKWTLDMPAELNFDMSNAVVISTNPQVIYVAVGKGHVYCIQDLGDKPKILWSYNANISNYVNSAAYNEPTPGSLALADDGTLYAGWSDQLLAFDTGYSSVQPIGIHGTVVDASGSPVAGAMVSVSTADHPLIDNNDKLYTTTNADGTYQVSVGGVSSSTTYYVASWKEGYTGSDVQTVGLSSESDSAVANFTLSPAKFNWALLANTSTNNADSDTGYAVSKAVDGDQTTYFKSNTASGYDVTAVPTYFMVDLGQNRSISEATVYWNYAYAKSYSIDYLADGEDPATGTWNTAYNTTTGTGGYPTTWTPNALGKDVYTVSTYKQLVNMPWYAAADTIKLPSVSARYWRVNATAPSNDYYLWQGTNLPWTAATSTYKYTYMGISEIALRDAAIAQVPYTTIPDVRNTPDGGGTIISSVVVTAVAGGGIPSGSICIETSDRTSGIRVDLSGVAGLDITTVGVGDKVSFTGRVRTDADGNKYIYAINYTKNSTGLPLEALGMNNKVVAEDMSQGLFVKTWGKVGAVDADSFTISDGNSAAVKVLCGDVAKPSVGDNIRVRGIVGKDATGPVLYMRKNKVEWTSADATYQALPFPGAYGYPREWLICGPFSTTYTADDHYSRLFATDYIAQATSDALSETTVRPKEGDPCGTNIWKYATTRTDLDGTLRFASTTNSEVYYAFLWLWSPVDFTAKVWVGSDDSNILYVGQDGYNLSTIGRTVGYGQDGYDYIPISAGLTPILIKVESGSGPCELNCLFTDAVNAGTGAYGGSVTAPDLGYVLNYAQ